MKALFNSSLLIIITILTSCSTKGQNRLIVTIPSAIEESEYIWSTIQDIKFFEENNYQISLPEGTFIEVLKKKAKENKLSDNDYEALKIYIKDSVYNHSDYEAGYRKIEQQLPLISKMISEISASSRNWDFTMFEQYQIDLTLYGPGGSYNPDEGSILIYTTPTGNFKQYDNPANTIIHEIVHIGIEASIIDTFNVPHALKERIVDTFVFLNFKEYLPAYRIQNMGDNRIDPFLKTKRDLKDLHTSVKQIMNNN